MNPVPDKWRVTFASAPLPGSIACERPADDREAEVWRDSNGDICAYGYVADGYGWMELVGTAKFRFDASNRVVTAFALPDVSPDLVHDAYCHAALPMALHFFGCEVLHASAVRTKRGIVALCARSETGKSTMASALSARGHPLWADDAVALDSAEHEHRDTPIRSMLLPFNLRLRHHSAEYFGRDGRAIGKQTDCEFSASPLAALCVLERSSESLRDVEIRRLAPGEALVALLPHAFCFSFNDPERKRAMLRFYLGVAARTPTFSVSFAPGFERLPVILDEIEAALPGFTPQSASDGESRGTVLAALSRHGDRAASAAVKLSSPSLSGEASRSR